MSWYSDKIKINPAYILTQRVNTPDILYPPFGCSLIKLFATARSEGLLICIYETYRSQERQLELFNKGATKLKKNGMHHFGIATDLIFLDPHGNPSWDAKYNWARMGKIGQSFGLVWGGSWSDFVDKPHFQLIPATVSAQARIIAEHYPSYAPSIDTDFPALIQLYNQAKANNFSAASIASILSFSGTPVVPPQPPLFTRDLFEGISGQDVLLLQKILNADPDTQIASQGVGSPGHESDYFGGLTKKAVQKFQMKYGIASPDNSAYGTVGPRTRAKLQELCNALHP